MVQDNDCIYDRLRSALVVQDNDCIYDWLRSTSVPKSAPTPQIGTHSSNRHPLLKSTPTPQIGTHSSNRHPLLKSAPTPQIGTHSSNRQPLLKSTPTPQIGIHWRRYLKLRSELRVILIGVLSKFSDLLLIYWLGLGYMSMMSLDVDLRKWETAIDLRIECRFENLKIWKRT